MNLLNLSISSFDDMKYMKESGKFLTMIAIWYIFADLAIGYIFSQPEGNNSKAPTSLVDYFNYGRSIESKVERLVNSSDEKRLSLARAGWFKPLENETENHGSGSTARKRVSVYGMSFSNRVGRELAKLDDSLDVQLYTGPSAPLNHSYAYYKSHHHGENDVVILTILASSLPRINTVTHMTSNFEAPSPHFYPRFTVKNNQLESTSVPVNSLEEFREKMSDPEKWQEIRNFLSKNDSYYDPFVFKSSWMDQSTGINLIRRAWGQRELNRTIARFHDNNGFKNHEGITELVQMILKDFSRSTEESGALPIVILFNNRGFADHLFTLVEKTLEEENLAYYSTHEKFPADDLGNFIPDGHFRPDIDKAIAENALEIIRNQN